MAVTSELIGKSPAQDEHFSDMDDGQKIALMVKRVNNFFETFDINIKRGKEDYDFVMEDMAQWEQSLLAARQLAKQPTFQINNIYAIVTSIIGQIRQNTPEFRIYSDIDETNASVKIDQNLIDLKENYLRQVSYENNAPLQFEIAAENQLCRGYGALLVTLEYESEFSFKQKIKINSILDPSWCFWDITDLSFSKSEGRFSGYMQQFTLEEFFEEWPDSKSSRTQQMPSSFPSNSLYNKMDYLWRGEDYISVCHYYAREGREIKIYQMSDGRVLKFSDAQKAIEEDREKRSSAKKQEGSLKKGLMKAFGSAPNQSSMLSQIPPLDFSYDENGNKISRDSVEYRMFHYVATKDEILQRTEWPSKLNPLVFVDGHSYWKDGQQYTKSFHRTAQDPQRVLNMMTSSAVGDLLNSHKSQWIGTPENFAGYEQIWRDPSIPGALIANRELISGQMPQHLPPPEVSPNYAPLIMQAISDINTSLGFVHPNNQQNESEMSGRAYNSRVRQGDLSTFIYRDNLAKAINQVYKIALSLMPTVLDSEQNIMVRDKNGKQRMERINVNTPDGTKNDMTSGNFTVEVTVGNDYQTQLSENLEQLLQLSSTIAPINPAAATLMMDLIAANTNLTNTPQIVERLRASMLGMSPTDILKHEMGIQEQQKPPQGPDPAQMQMQIQMKQLQLEEEKIKTEQQKIQMEAQKIQMEHEKNMVDRQKSIDEVKMKELEIEREKIAAHAEIEKYAKKSET